MASEFIRWLANTYGHTQLIAIRRQADAGRDVQSLMGFLLDLRQALPDQDPLQSQIAEDIERLEAVTQLAVDHARDTIAHLIDPELRRDSSLSAESLTFADLHAAIDAITEIFNHYAAHFLETTVGFGAWVLTPWRSSFTVPWLDDSAWD